MSVVDVHAILVKELEKTDNKLYKDKHKKKSKLNQFLTCSIYL